MVDKMMFRGPGGGGPRGGGFGGGPRGGGFGGGPRGGFGGGPHGGFGGGHMGPPPPRRGWGWRRGYPYGCGSGCMGCALPVFLAAAGLISLVFFAFLQIG